MAACYHATVGSAALLLLACSSRATRAPPARAEPDLPPAPISAARAQPTATGWEALARIRERPPLTPEPLRARGHLDGRQLALVRISPEAEAAYLARAPDAEFPPGTLVTESSLLGPSLTPGPIFAMRKDHAGRWRFAQFDAQGRLEPAQNAALCERCHAEAARGFIFGLPQVAGDDRARP